MMMIVSVYVCTLKKAKTVISKMADMVSKLEDSNTNYDRSINSNTNNDDSNSICNTNNTTNNNDDEFKFL